MVRNDLKCIFIHINKTGGVSIIRTLGMLHIHISVPLLFSDEIYLDEQYSEWMSKPNRYKRSSEDNWATIEEMREKWDEYYKFAVIRNPWDRVVSDHFYCKKDGFLSEDASFRQDVKNTLDNYERWKLPCYDWLAKGGKVDVDRVCRFENLQDDFNLVCDDLEIKRKRLPHLNKTNHVHYSEYYDDELREMVAEKYKKDIEYFGYEFGK